MSGRPGVLEIQLFGGLSLVYDGEPLPPLPSRHARLLLARLVLGRGRPEPRALLCDRLWPDATESRGRRRLSHALWQVQDCLGERAPDRPYVLTPGDSLRFDRSAPYHLDVEEFEERLDAVGADTAVDDAGVRNLRRAVELYQGDLLAGSYESWVVAEQDRLRQRHVGALARLVEACKQRGGFDEALQLARRLTHQAPLREDAHREVMRLSVLVGQTSLALEQFERCRSVLDEELGTGPSAATVELYERIASGRDAGPSRRAPIEELRTDRLVGRDDERVRLVDQLERTLAGAPGTVFVEGEPGVGKTQLLAQAADDAGWRGFSVLWGAGTGAQLPYGAVRDALLPALDPVRVAQLGALVEPVWLREAARLLPPLASAGDGLPTGSLQGPDAAERMRHALTAVLTGLASLEPVLLVVEDLHAADHETMELLRALVRHPDPGRLLLLASFRDAEARRDEAVWSELRALDREAHPVRLALGPLTAFDTAALLRETLGTPGVPAALTATVHRECGGNPLYVLELLRALRDDGTLDEGRLGRLDTLDVPVTAGLRGLIADRLAQLGPDATTVVELAAVLGQQGRLATLRAGAPLEPRELAGALGELARRNLLQLDEDEFRFTHAATRTVLVEELPVERRAQLHAVAADATEASAPDEVEAMATHLRLAGDARRALPWLVRAADRAVELHAHATAATHLTAAVELCATAPVAVAERIRLLLRTEEVLDVLGRRDEQAAVLDELEPLVAGDEQRAVLVRLRRSTLLAHLDEYAGAIDVARSAVDASGGDDALRGRALTTLGHVLLWGGRTRDAVTALDEAVSLLDDDGELVRARSGLATALRSLQRFAEADEALSAAVGLAERTDDEVALVGALGALADLRAETGSSGEAVALYDRAVALARRIGFRHREGVGLVNLGTVRLLRAEVGAALAAFDEAEVVFRALDNRRGAAMVQLNRAWLRHRWLGRDDQALDDARAATGFLRGIGADAAAAAAQETVAGVLRRLGQVADARAALDEGVRAATRAGDDHVVVQLARGRTELLLLDDPASAVGVAEEALDRAGRIGATSVAADLAALAALAAQRSGDPDAARRHLRTAVAALAESAEPHLVHHRCGLVAEGLGDEEEAGGHHRVADELLGAALADLDTGEREAAVQAVPEHAAVVAAGAAHRPRTVELRLARAGAPSGRALTPDETTEVRLELAPPATSPDERRAQVLDVLGQLERHGAEATISDLTLVFDVSTSTIRRDLRALRAQGESAATRGSDAG